MIIVSQDGETIVNFKRVNVININQLNKKEIDAYFNCNENQEDSLFLGEYATEERAKEVLNEIVKKYADCLYSDDGYGSFQTITIPPKVYKMPKE